MTERFPAASAAAVIELLNRQTRERLEALVAAIEPVRVQVPRMPVIGDRLRAAITEMQERLDEEWERSVPDNWQGMDLVEEIDPLLGLMDETGWSLVWVPSSDTLQRLLASRTKDPARRIVRFEKRILADLEAGLAMVSAPEVRDVRSALAEAMTSHLERRYRAAQALNASVLTALIEEFFNPPTMSGVRGKGSGLNPKEVAIRNFRRAVIFQRMAHALEQFRRGQDPIPIQFNRHASAHTVAPEQFTRANSLAALLLGVSVTREIERELQER